MSCAVVLAQAVISAQSKRRITKQTHINHVPLVIQHDLVKAPVPLKAVCEIVGPSIPKHRPCADFRASRC